MFVHALETSVLLKVQDIKLYYGPDSLVLEASA